MPIILPIPSRLSEAVNIEPCDSTSPPSSSSSCSTVLPEDCRFKDLYKEDLENQSVACHAREGQLKRCEKGSSSSLRQPTRFDSVMSARTLRGSNGSNDSEAGCVSPKKGGKRRVSPSRITRKRRRNLMKHGRKMDVEASDIDVIGATSDVNDGEDTPKGVQLERGLSFLSSLTSLWKSKPNVSASYGLMYG